MLGRSIVAATFALAVTLGVPAVSSADVNGNPDYKPLIIWAAGCDATASLEGVAQRSGAVSLKQIVNGVPVNLGSGFSQQVKAGDVVRITGPKQPEGSVVTLQGFWAGYDDTATLEPVTPVTTSRRLSSDQC